MSSVLSDLSPTLTPALPAEEKRRASAVAPKVEERDWSQPSKTSSEQTLSFSDFLSVINPLQHIPIVGSIYRAITGDTISPVSRVIGGLLFGGPVGLIASAFNAVVEQTQGKDLGDQALALFSPDKGTPAPAAPPTQFAAIPAPEPEPGDLAVAPLSRTALGTTAPQDAGSIVGGDRTLGASLLYGPPAAGAATLAAQGRTLADYRNFTGRPLPVVDTSRSGGSHAAPVRLQPTVTLPERTRTSGLPATRDPRPAEAVAPAAVSTGSTDNTTNTAAGITPTNNSFVAAMARGLDRYREQRRLGTSAMQIDTTL